MNDHDLNLRARLAAFMDEDGSVREPLDGFAPLHDSDHCLRLLVATGISFQRCGDEMVAESMSQQHREPVQAGDVPAAARRAAAALAANWVDAEDLARYRQRMG